MPKAFLDRILFGEMAVSPAVIAPDRANARAVQCCEKVGFRAIRIVHVVDDEHPENTGDELVMLLRRP